MRYIGPGMVLEDYSSGKLAPIDVFQARIESWTLTFAKSIASQKDSGIAILLLTSSVIEPMGGAIRGQGNAEQNFCAGFERAFPSVRGSQSAGSAAKMVCDLLRNGLFHEGFIKAGLVIEQAGTPVRVTAAGVHIDPVRFLDSVASAFSEVCSEIRSAEADSAVRQQFDKYWKTKLDNQSIKFESNNFDAGAVEQLGTITLAPRSEGLIVSSDGSATKIG